MNKQILESKPYENNAHKGSVYILRIATILLAIVSWWATAKGMENYVFSTQWQAYLASLAIQSILLGLNFYLPTFWRYSMSNFSKCGIGMLSMIVLFCSSWFSYVFIAEYSYKESWSTISRLLLQSSYREGLYGALEYAEEYDEVLRDIIWNQITELYGRAKIIEGNEAQVIQPMDLSQDSINYADNSEFAANREISTAIQFMRNALSENASASDQEEAVEQISELKKQVDEEINILENDIEREYSVIEEASNRLQKARENLRNALEGTDTIELENAANIANENYETQQKKD